MDFSNFKIKALELKDKAFDGAVKVKDKAIDLKDKAMGAKDKAVEMKNKAIDAKDKAVDMKDKAVEMKDNTVNKTTETINSAKKKVEETKSNVKDELSNNENTSNSESSFPNKEKIEIKNIIKKSKTTSFTNPETGIEKFYKHRSIIIFAIEGSDFYKKSLYILPIIITKAFTQNITVKLFKSKLNGINLQDYNISETELPSLVVFEEEKILKNINGEENILKLVKSFSLDINKQIDDA